MPILEWNRLSCRQLNVTFRREQVLCFGKIFTLHLWCFLWNWSSDEWRLQLLKCILQDFLRVVKCKMWFCKLILLADRSNNFVFDMSLKALQDKKKMMDRGNLVAEEDVMTKLTAIKTDKILHFYQRWNVFWVTNFCGMEQVGEIICDLMVWSFAICHKFVSAIARICRNSANVLKLSQLSRHLSK